MSRNCNVYCCRYYHDGSWWGINITAYNIDDAEERVKKLGNLQLLGELAMTIPDSIPKARWWVSIVVWVRNLLFQHNVIVMTTPLARASVDRGVDVVVTVKHGEQKG